MTKPNDLINLLHTVENPKLSLLLIRSSKGFDVIRTESGESLGQISVRDYSKIAGTDWDTRQGRYLSITFIDGSFRVHDVYKGVKITALLRTGVSGIDCTLWDQVDIDNRFVGNGNGSGDGAYAFDGRTSILNAMPELAKFSGDISHLHAERYVPSNEKWRCWDGDKGVLDIRILRSSTFDSLVYVLNGDYILMSTPPGEVSVQPNNYYAGEQMCRILKSSNEGEYICYYKSGGIKRVDILPFIKSTCSMETLDNIQSLKELAKYLSHHLTLLTRDIFDHYNKFVHRVCEEAYGYERLYRELKEVFLTGYVSDDLSQWLRYTVGTKRMEDWNQLVHELFYKTNEILTLNFIPGCERFLVLLERCQGLIMAMRITRVQNQTQSMSVGTELDLDYCRKECFELKRLKKDIQKLLSLSIKAIKSASINNEYLTTFVAWLEDRVERESDKNLDTALDYRNDATFGLKINHAIEMSFSSDEKLMAMGPKRHDLFERAPFEQLINGIPRQLELIDTKYIKPELSRLITFSEVSPPTTTLRVLHCLRDLVCGKQPLYVGAYQRVEDARVFIVATHIPTRLVPTGTESPTFQVDVTTTLLDLEKVSNHRGAKGTMTTSGSLTARILKRDSPSLPTDTNLSINTNRVGNLNNADINTYVNCVHNNNNNNNEVSGNNSNSNSNSTSSTTTPSELSSELAMNCCYTAIFTLPVMQPSSSTSRETSDPCVVVSLSFAVIFDSSASNEIAGIRVFR